MEELRTALNDVREQLASSRRESDALRQEFEAVRQQLEHARGGPESLATLAEDQQVLSAKVEDQYQTKVESGSRYRLRLSGLVLVNVFGSRGNFENMDLPLFVTPPNAGDSKGSFGASARQSQVNLDIFGPQWKGAKTSAALSMDFFGGFPLVSNGVTSGLARVRTASMSMNWAGTSVVAGQDGVFFSPLSPTSVASAAYPALSSSGNLWSWTPQVHVEHRIQLKDNSNLSVQWGVLDPLTGEPPDEYARTPTAGEQNRTPAVATRFGWKRTTTDRVASLGAGGYYARQNWNFGRTVDAWAGTADWNLPLGKEWAFSGEFYRGRAIGGLGGGITGSVVYTDTRKNPAIPVWPLDSVGGWSQLKFKPAANLEFNAAFGEDQPFRSGHGYLPKQRLANAYDVARNSSGFLNVIFRPRSNLLFSLEYRRLWTSGVYDPRQKGDHVTVSSGIEF